jgi:hypothetical protein
VVVVRSKPNGQSGHQNPCLLPPPYRFPDRLPQGQSTLSFVPFDSAGEGLGWYPFKYSILGEGREYECDERAIVGAFSGCRSDELYTRTLTWTHSIVLNSMFSGVIYRVYHAFRTCLRRRPSPSAYAVSKIQIGHGTYALGPLDPLPKSFSSPSSSISLLHWP